MHCKNALGDSSLQSCKKEISRFVRICVWSYVDYKVCFVTIDHENPNEFQLNILLEKQLYCLCYANYNMKLFNINLFFLFFEVVKEVHQLLSFLHQTIISKLIRRHRVCLIKGIFSIAFCTKLKWNSFDVWQWSVRIQRDNRF